MTEDELAALRRAFPQDLQWAREAAAAMGEALRELDDWTPPAPPQPEAQR
jgi:hypothetical protein